MSNPRATLPTRLPPPELPKKSPLLLVGVVVGCVVVSVLVIGGLLLFGPSPPPPPLTPAQPEPPPIAAKTDSAETKIADTKRSESPVDGALVDDDGKTLWTSPTDGEPLDLAYLAPGAQVFICLRPAELLKNAESEKIRTALGPEGQRAIAAIEQAAHLELEEMEQLTIGCQMTSDNAWTSTIVVHTNKPLSVDLLQNKLFDAVKKEHKGKKYLVATGNAYYLPDGDADRILVVALEGAMPDVIDLAGQPPPLRRDVERLLEHTDSDRQLTVILAPNSLFTQGQSIFSGELTRLREPLFWFFGDELGGVALSANTGENFFLELIATPTLETSTEKASITLRDRVAQIPDRIEQYVVSLNAQSYGRLVIARFPEMLRKLAAYTRSGFDKDHTTLRCYLPAIAGHNLLLAAELTLAEQPGAAPATNAVASKTETTSPVAATSVKDRLAKVTSLKFARDTLESALDQLSQDIGAPIVIRGPDLQADGITKNQSFGIDLTDKPASDILVEILRLANPDKSATGANDKRQKLVYFVEAKPDKAEQIVVTTRAKAAERKNDLPNPFRVEKP
jgi:hypothetical protein